VADRARILGLVAALALTPGALVAQTVVVNTASAAYGTSAGTDSVRSTTVSTTVEPAQLALRKVLDGPATARIGDQVSYTIVYTNPSAVVARGVVLSDTLAVGLAYVTAQPAATVAGQVVSWALGDVAPGDSAAVTLTVRVTGDVRDTLRVRNVAVAVARNAAGRTATAGEVALVGLQADQLTLEKTADVLEVGLGETAPYTLVVENTGANAVADLRIHDLLPDGGRYAAGSAIGADSVRADGRDLTFFVTGPLAAGARHTVRYAVAMVSASGDVIENRAYVTAENESLRSAEQVAWIRYRRIWPMQTRVAVGNVWMDLDANGVQSAGESGVAGVDVWTDDGEVATTDDDGKFSYRNLRAGGHAFRIDPSTIPVGYRLVAGEDIVTLDATGWTTPRIAFRLVPRGGELVEVRLPVAWRFTARPLRPAPVADTSAASAPPAAPPSTYAPVVLSGVTFEVGSATLTPASATTLDRVAQSLVANPAVRVEISGHTDATGSRTLNTALAMNRARSVTAYLAARGVDSSRLVPMGYGPDRPVATNETAGGRARNRRVQLDVILDPIAPPAADLSFLDDMASAGLLDAAALIQPPAPTMVEYEVVVENRYRFALAGLRVRFSQPPDSAVTLIGDVRTPLGGGTVTLPAIPAASRAVFLAWAPRAADSAWAAIETAGRQVAVHRAEIHNPLRPVEGVFHVRLITDALPLPADVPPGQTVEIRLRATAAGWPELTYPADAEWEPVPGTTRVGGEPAPDPAIQVDAAGRRFLSWSFGRRPQDDVTLELRPAGRREAGMAVTVPALRSADERAAERSRAFLTGPGVELFGVTDGMVSARDRLFIGARGEPGAPVTLFDGDSTIAEGTLRLDGVHDFIAVPLAPGPHRLRVRMPNSWNQVRWDSMTVHVSGPPATMAGPAGTLPFTADGLTTREVRVRLLDAWGVPVAYPAYVTVSVDGAEATGDDADRSSVGFQQRSDSAGWVALRLKPGRDVRRGTLRLESGDARYDADLEILPVVRDLMVTGVGRVGVGASPDAFGSVTARGRLDDRTSLTLSVDSRRLDAGRDEFGRTSDPLEEAQYPILGDASQQQVLGASRHAVSARLERGFDWLAVGDVATDHFARGLTLTGYRRALSGGALQATTGAVDWQAFGSLTNQSLEQAQIRGGGISGPYALPTAAVAGTERLVIEVRDLENPQRILTQQALTRYVDYQVDYAAGTLLFKRPIPAADLGGNPVFIVVTYEGQGTGTQRVVGGIRASLDGRGLTGVRGLDSLRVGLTAIHASEATGSFDLTGVDFRLLRFAGVEVGGEVSHSHAPDSSGFATALRGSVTLLDGAARLSASWTRIGGGFSNPSNTALRAGTQEIKLGGAWRVGTTQLRAEHEQLSSAADGVARHRTSAGVLQPIGRTLQVEARQTYDTYARGPDDGRSAAGEARLTWTPFPRFKLWSEGRQQFASDGALARPSHVGVGAGYQITKLVGLEVRHRRVLLPGEESYSVTGLGLRSDLGFGTQAWGSYQLAGAAGGQYNAALVGLSNRLTLGSVWNVNTLFERRVGVSRAAEADPERALPFLETEDDYWALGVGVELLPHSAPYRMSARGELRDGTALSSRLFTVAGDVAFNRSLALLSRQELMRTEHATELSLDVSRRVASLWGLAFRPIKSNRLNALAKISWLEETNPRGGGVLTSRGDEARLIGAAELIWAPVARLELAGRYAVRQTRADRPLEEGGVQRLTSTADYVGGRGSVTLAPWLVARGDWRLLVERTSGTERWDAAPSLGLRLIPGLELAAGYRFGNLRDPDFAAQGGHGAFVTLSARVTEGLLPNVADFWRSRFGNDR